MASFSLDSYSASGSSGRQGASTGHGVMVRQEVGLIWGTLSSSGMSDSSSRSVGSERAIRVEEPIKENRG